MENSLLLEAKALYKDRIRIALSAFIIVFAITYFVYYTTGIAGLEATPPINGGVTRGWQVVAAFNTTGLLIVVALMVISFRFWVWAFLPGPASLFTVSVVRGILGPDSIVKQTVGKRFKVTLDDELSFRINCYIQEKGTDDWFTYRLVSSELHSANLRNVALRHGFALQGNRFVANVSNDELHHRTFLLAKAMLVAISSV